MISLLRPFILTLAVLFLRPALFSQDTPNPENDVIKVRTSLFNVPLTVSDRVGRRVAGLKKEDILVYIGTEKLNIEYFADTNEPVNFAIVIDSSGSTVGIRRRISSAARKFVETLSELDRGTVVRFDDDVKVSCQLTTDKKKIRYAVDTIEIDPEGGALMNDAILFVLTNQFKELQGRKAVILLTDAGEVNNDTNKNLIRALSASDVVVYPIIYQTLSVDKLVEMSGSNDGAKALRKLRSISYSDLVKYPPFDHMHEIARVTGGRLLFADGDNFETAFQSIADELRKQYVIGFYVDADNGSDRREISIKVDRPDAVIRTKQSIKIRNDREINNPR